MWSGNNDQNAVMSTMQSHTGPLSLISCVSAREASPVDDVAESKSETTKKKRFHPFRNLRRIFRRKNRQLDINDVVDDLHEDGRSFEPKSSSTGRLIDEEQTESRRRSSSLAPGLSLSHDSVFKPDRTDSGHSSSDLENSSLSIPTLLPTPRVPRFQAELADVLRRRVRDDSDDEDLGLPRSRCSSLATDYPDKFAERAGKSQSSCSEGSLLSTGSSFEDDLQTSGEGSEDLDLKVTRHILSHSAAKHKMAVRPRRNHAAGVIKRQSPKPLTSSLPVTPEVNEEPPAPLASSARQSSATEPISLPSPLRPETWSKSASLPHGAALNSEPAKISRSLSLKAAKMDVEDKQPVDDDNNEPKRFSLTLLNQVESQTGSPFNSIENVSILPNSNDNSNNRSSLSKLNDESSFENIESKLKTSDESKRSSFETIESKLKTSDEPKRSSLSNDSDSRRSSLSKSNDDSRRSSLSKSLNRRQRVDPIEIPVGTPPATSRMRVSYSTSPPAPTWPTATSPPKAIWPEMRLESQPERTGMFIKNESRQQRRDSRDSKPPIQKSHSFHKDGPAPPLVYNNYGGSSLPKNLGDDDSNKRLYLKNNRKVIRKEEKESLNAKLTKKSTSLESIDSNGGPAKSLRASSTDSVRNDEPPQYANLGGHFDGYENIEIIEIVKKEQQEQQQQQQLVVEPPVVKSKEPTLVERRKSELPLTTEEEPAVIRTTFKKQTSLDLSQPKQIPTSVVIIEKDEVVLRRKSQTNTNDEPSELMKVFARRSLKAKDEDDQEGSRSRDSDKENEAVDEPPPPPPPIATPTPTPPADSPKIRPATPLKPTVAARNSVLNKFKPAVTDKPPAAVKRPSFAKEKPPPSEEMKKIEESIIITDKLAAATADSGKISEEIVDGPGFKRIQDRRAEWEKRLQAAKN